MQSMELDILGMTFEKKIRSFLRPRTDNWDPLVVFFSGCVASYRSRGRQALLFMTPHGCWIWDGVTPRDQETFQNLPVVDQVYVFDVELMKNRLYITDVLVYAGRSVVMRGFMERIETARLWLSIQPGVCVRIPQEGLPGPCPSAHVDGCLWVSETLSIVVKRNHPVTHVDRLWKHAPTWADGVVLHKLLTRYTHLEPPQLVRGVVRDSVSA
jgi:hypothetical protein